MPALRKGRAAFLRQVQALTRTALGPGLRDRRTVSVAAVLLGAETIAALRARGMSSQAAADAMAEVSEESFYLESAVTSALACLDQPCTTVLDCLDGVYE